MKRLAIIIPAFKQEFLDKALQSIAAQTCKEFKVYVCDDASPYDLCAVCNRWQDSLDLQYYRFENNMGGQDLTGHWMRCIGLSREPWVWLFSDDDLMSPDCVAMFYRELQKTEGQFSLYHFDVDIIDQEGRALFETPKFPDVLSSEEFVIRRFQSCLNSFVPDYIFFRNDFINKGGFESFPKAWCSDDATWAKLAASTGIKAIPSGKVCWRRSGQNITSCHKDDGAEKFEAALQYLEWLSSCLAENQIKLENISSGQLIAAGREWFYKHTNDLGVYWYRQGIKRCALRLQVICQTSLLLEMTRMFFSDLKRLKSRFLSITRIGRLNLRS